MKNNVKILAGALITAITATSVWMTFANEETQTQTWLLNKVKQRVELTVEQKAEMDEIKSIFDKQKSWETLTAEESAKLEEFKSNNPKIWREGKGKWMWKWFDKMWKWWFMNHLTEEEKTALESMTDDEKKAFFDTKKAEMQVKRQSHEAVIDKLLAWEKLTADEEAVRAEIIKHRAEMKTKMTEIGE